MLRSATLLTVLAAVPQTAAQVAESPPVAFSDVLAQNGLEPSLARGLTHDRIEVRLLAADTPREDNYSQHYQEPAGPDDVCGFRVAHPSFSRERLIHQYARIPLKYVGTFAASDLTFARTLLHEARHCMQYEKGEDPLPLEIEADLFAAEAIRGLPGGEHEIAVLRSVRAVAALLGQARSHATALSLDALEKGTVPPRPEEVGAAYEALYERLVAEAILDPNVHGVFYDEEGDLVRAVYGFLKEGLAAGTFGGWERRAAELYVDGVTHLGPALLEAHRDRVDPEAVGRTIEAAGRALP